MALVVTAASTGWGRVEEVILPRGRTMAIGGATILEASMIRIYHLTSTHMIQKVNIQRSVLPELDFSAFTVPPSLPIAAVSFIDFSKVSILRFLEAGLFACEGTFGAFSSC